MLMEPQYLDMTEILEYASWASLQQVLWILSSKQCLESIHSFPSLLPFPSVTPNQATVITYVICLQQHSDGSVFILALPQIRSPYSKESDFSNVNQIVSLICLKLHCTNSLPEP